jgi:hypothetical protein
VIGHKDIKEIWLRGCGLELCGSRFVSAVGPCEHGNKTSSSIKDGEFID